MDNLTIKRIVDALKNRGDSHLPVVDSEEFKRLMHALAAWGRIIESRISLLPIEGIPEGSERIPFVPPRFTEAGDPSGGSVYVSARMSS